MWQVNYVGKPAAIKRALKDYGSGLHDPKRKEHFESARDALERLLDLNSEDVQLSLTASNYDLESVGIISGVNVVLVQSNAKHVE